MRKVYWLVAVIVLAFLGDRLGGWVLGKIADQSQFRYSRLYRGDAGADILFIGNSRGLIFFQPYVEEKTGLTTCNLSYNGMPVQLANTLIKDYLERHDPPKLLVLDVSLLDKKMDSKLTTGFNFYTPRSLRLASLLRDSFPNDYYAGKVSHLYRFNSEVFQRALYFWKKSDESWLLDRVISASMQQNVGSQKEFLFDYSPAMLASFKDAIDFATRKGVRVELVVNPYYPPFANKIGNLPQLIADVHSATGLQVKDYSTSITEVEGFGDYQHLNKLGARLYLDKLLKDGILDTLSELGGR